jgi:hypothetical protein
MEKIAVDGPKTPIGFLSSLWKGVEFVNANPGVLFIPVIMDSFLWLGPHLSVQNLMKPFIDSLTYTTVTNAANATIIDALNLAAEKFNLFSVLAFLPFFPPSLMAGVAPDQNPFGNPVVVPVANGFLALLLFAGLFATSLLIGSGYWVWAGRATQSAPWKAADAFGRWVRTILVMVLLCGAFLILLLAFLIPGIILISLITMLIPGVGSVLLQLFYLLGGGFIFWVLLFIMFSMHGTVLYRDNILASVWNSINTSRWMYPISIWIPLLLILLNFLTASIWSLAPDGNWAGMVGIVGNAYTSSVVVVASMAYYMDKRRWIDEVRIFLQTRTAGKIPPGTA